MKFQECGKKVLSMLPFRKHHSMLLISAAPWAAKEAGISVKTGSSACSTASEKSPQALERGCKSKRFSEGKSKNAIRKMSTFAKSDFN